MHFIDTYLASVYAVLLLLQEGKIFADENNLLFMETSAKAAVNVAEIFTAIGNCCLMLFIF